MSIVRYRHKFCISMVACPKPIPALGLLTKLIINCFLKFFQLLLDRVLRTTDTPRIASRFGKAWVFTDFVHLMSYANLTSSDCIYWEASISRSNSHFCSCNLMFLHCFFQFWCCDRSTGWVSLFPNVVQVFDWFCGCLTPVVRRYRCVNRCLLHLLRRPFDISWWLFNHCRCTILSLIG